MTSADDLIPELSQWNNGAGVALTDWIWMTGRTDHAVGYGALFWPDFEEFEGYILRCPLDLELLRSWEGGDHTRAQIETAMNVLFLDFDYVFRGEDVAEPLRRPRIEHVARLMTEMLATKLRRDFPDRSFSAFVIDDLEEYGVSFHQTGAGGHGSR